jgi:hypothetical protein
LGSNWATSPGQTFSISSVPKMVIGHFWTLHSTIEVVEGEFFFLGIFWNKPPEEIVFVWPVEENTFLRLFCKMFPSTRLLASLAVTKAFAAQDYHTPNFIFSQLWYIYKETFVLDFWFCHHIKKTIKNKKVHFFQIFWNLFKIF